MLAKSAIIPTLIQGHSDKQAQLQGNKHPAMSQFVAIAGQNATSCQHRRMTAPIDQYSPIASDV
ncbi:hypothetical protein UF64_12175 [Thalassospira sp. HJ]|nr:hypothetical protein UF64_12175 [Thalassospira sp. HJ]